LLYNFRIIGDASSFLAQAFPQGKYLKVKGVSEDWDDNSLDFGQAEPAPIGGGSLVHKVGKKGVTH
jgi:hypothetical protein